MYVVLWTLLAAAEVGRVAVRRLRRSGSLRGAACSATGVLVGAVRQALVVFADLPPDGPVGATMFVYFLVAMLFGSMLDRQDARRAPSERRSG